MSRSSRNGRRSGVAVVLGIAVMVAGAALGTAAVSPPVPAVNSALNGDNCPPSSCGSNHNQVLL